MNFYEKKVYQADEKWNVKGESKVQLSFEEAKKQAGAWDDRRESRQSSESLMKEANGHLQNKIATAA